ncbi:recombinase family protein [Peribacillus muralis]|uniref:recombinase family protein n=1 Tax=Peribacillus muralis TaxID=264697 RepID=UPI003D02E978
MKAIYVRVSTEEQAIKGNSIDAQIDACIKKAGTYDVLRYVDEGFSGELLERPGLTKLRHDVRDGIIDQVICYDPDRLSRKLMIQLIIDDEFRKKGIQVVYVNGEYANTSEGQLFFSMRGAISEFEKAKIKERTMSGRRQKAKKGKVVKDGHLYGYEYDKKNETYKIYENEAKVVKMIFDYYTKGTFLGVNGIAKHLTEIGIPTKKGNKVWHRQVVSQILRNQTYTGKFYQNRYDTEGDYVTKQRGEVAKFRLRPEEEWVLIEIDSIITEEQFEHAQHLLKESRRRSTNNGVHDYLLSGLVRCGRCGGTMTGKRTLSHGKDFYIYCCRRNYAGAKDNGCGKQISENKLNNAVWADVKELFDDPEKFKEYGETQEDKQYLLDELNRVTKELEKCKKGRQRLITLVSLDDDLNLEEIKDQIKALQEKEKELTFYYNQIQDELKVESGTENIFNQALEVYLQQDIIDHENKKEFLRMIVKEVVVSPEGDASIYLF